MEQMNLDLDFETNYDRTIAKVGYTPLSVWLLVANSSIAQRALSELMGMEVDFTNICKVYDRCIEDHKSREYVKYLMDKCLFPGGRPLCLTKAEITHLLDYEVIMA